MGNLSTFMKNGAQLQLKAGIAAIAAADLVSIGGPGLEAYTVGCADYAKYPASGTILPQTSLNASAMPGVGRMPVARDSQGNIFTLGTNSSGNAVVYKSSPTGAMQSSQTLDATATTCRTGKLLPLSNGTFAAVYARTAGAMYFTIFDPALNIIAGPTSIATERNNTNVVYHDAIELSGGGFAVFYQTSANTNIAMQTYTNAGAPNLGATNIVTLASTAADCFIRAKQQIGTSNIVVAYRSAMTVGGTAGTGFVVVNASGAVQAGPTNVDNTATFGFVELAVLNGFFAIAEGNGTNLKCASYSNAGALQGSVYSTADTLNSATYPQVKLATDGAQFWLAYFGSAANGLNVVQIPTADATTGKATTGMSSATLAATTYALDAEIINGMLVALAASSATSGQYYMTVGLPDASLGISAPYLKTAATAFGSAASTTGSNMPRVLSGGGGLYTGTGAPTNYPSNPAQCGDWTAIFSYDQQNTAATYIGILKFEASAIIGVSQAAVAVNNAGTTVTINSGPGAFLCNILSGTQGVVFNHSQGLVAGGIGTLFAVGVILTSSVLSGSGSSAGLFGVANVTPAGFMGVFGSGQYQVFYANGTYTVPAGVSRIRVRTVGGGAGGKNAGGGGSGGGYAHGVFVVSPGASFAVTVGSGGTAGASPTAGGTSSFGSLISATGGAITGGAGGVGTGGDYQASGGVGGGNSGTVGSGGAAGSQLGVGGAGGTGNPSGGGGVGGGTGGGSTSQAGGSAFGAATSTLGAPDITGAQAAATGANGAVNPINATIRFPFDGFTGGGGGNNSGTAGGNGGVGAGGGGGASTGGTGGTGAGGAASTTAGTGGLGAGGAGGGSTGAAGGQGFVIVEW